MNESQRIAFANPLPKNTKFEGTQKIVTIEGIAFAVRLMCFLSDEEATGEWQSVAVIAGEGGGSMTTTSASVKAKLSTVMSKMLNGVGEDEIKIHESAFEMVAIKCFTPQEMLDSPLTTKP